MNREILWRKHQMIQSQFRQWEGWYDKNGVIILELDEKRQEIAKKYFVFEKGEIKVNAQQQYIPQPGIDLALYDNEMAVLMSAEEEIEE